MDSGVGVWHSASSWLRHNHGFISVSCSSARHILTSCPQMGLHSTDAPRTVKQILLISLLSPRLLRGAQLFIGWSCHRLLLGVRGWDCVDTIWIVDDLLPKMLMVTPLWPLDNNDPTSLQGTMTVIDPEPELGGGGRRWAESRNHFPVPALTPASWFMWPGYCFLSRLIESL